MAAYPHRLAFCKSCHFIVGRCLSAPASRSACTFATWPFSLAMSNPVRYLHIGASGDQKLGDICMAVCAGVVQSCVFHTIHGRCVRANVEERLRNVAFRARQVQRCLSAQGRCLCIGTSVEERLHNRIVASLARHKQRCLSAPRRCCVGASVEKRLRDGNMALRARLVQCRLSVQVRCLSAQVSISAPAIATRPCAVCPVWLAVCKSARASMSTWAEATCPAPIAA